MAYIEFKSEGLEKLRTDKVSVKIGGTPVTPNYANEIGADIYALDGPLNI